MSTTSHRHEGEQVRDKAVDPRPDIDVKRRRSAMDETGSPKILVEVVGIGDYRPPPPIPSRRASSRRAVRRTESRGGQAGCRLASPG